MESYVKGFSYLPECNALINTMKYVEEDALEQTWKSARRERLKQREQKIWETFVQEQDIVSSVCEDDPYQFIEQLPEKCIQELLEIELQKLKQEVQVEIQTEKAEDKMPSTEDNQCIVTLIEESANEKVGNLDEKEDHISGPDEELLNESVSPPCTVRERSEGSPVSSAPRPISADKVSSKSSENVANTIESSIYCAKVKELRLKINDELMSLVSRLEEGSINIDPEELPKLKKRAVEFCGRFNRVHVYQMQRQIHDMKRHNDVAPVARHTHWQAQLARIVSLHQNMQQAVQTVHKFVSRSGCCGETGAAVGGLAQLLREAASSELYSVPKLTLSDRDIAATCDKLEAAVKQHTVRMEEHLNNCTNSINSSSNLRKANKLKNKKKLLDTWSKNGKPMSGSDSRLSMYSLDVVRKRGGRPPSVRGAPPSVTLKSRARTIERGEKPIVKEPSPTRVLRKSPRLQRSRAPQELHTLVEAVVPCTSINPSRDQSPRDSPRSDQQMQPLSSLNVTPRTLKLHENKSLNNTPRSRVTPRNKTKTCNKVCDSAHISPRNTLKRETENVKDTLQSPRTTKGKTGNVERDVTYEGDNSSREKRKVADSSPEDVSRLLRELCAGDVKSSRNDHASGPKNVQLICVKGSSPRQPSTPQLLRILEETIQKKSPKTTTPRMSTSTKDADKYRMAFNVSDDVTDKIFQYRTKFVQHMLASSLYANSAVGKPWEMIGSVSEQIINELLLKCAEEMQLYKYTQDLYNSEIFC